MGFSLSWVAVRTDTPQAVQDALALRGTGEREERPESEITGAVLPGGWYLIVSDRDRFKLEGGWYMVHWNRDKLKLESDEVLSRLSRIGEIVICSIEEHVMYSSAAFWRDGRAVWAVSHQGDRDIEHLEVKGEPPAAFAAIRDRLHAQQAAEGEKEEVDYIFEIPVELAFSIAGYRHDAEIPALGKDAFEILATTKTTPERTWWRRLFAHRPS